MSNQKVMEILSTPDPNLIEWGDTEQAAEEYEKEMDKYKMRLLIESDPKAMLATIEYGFNYYYALCMRSKDRKVRAEGVKMGTGAVAKEEAEGVGIGPKLLHAMGLGRLTKYEKVYTNRD